MTSKETLGFNARLWFRFVAIARPYWLSSERWPAWGMFALLIVLLLGQTAFSVLFNQETGSSRRPSPQEILSGFGPPFYRYKRGQSLLPMKMANLLQIRQ